MQAKAPKCKKDSTIRRANQDCKVSGDTQKSTRFELRTANIVCLSEVVVGNGEMVKYISFKADWNSFNGHCDTNMGLPFLISRQDLINGGRTFLSG